MIHRNIATALVLAGLAGSALASDGRNAGSLLLYPEFDNRTGAITVVTVTNADLKVGASDIGVEFIYIGKFGRNGQDLGCGEQNRSEIMTPADTITLLTNIHNPNQSQGYLYVFTKDTVTPFDPISHNYLTGNVMTVDGIAVLEYSINPVSYVGLPNMGTTDLDGDGFRDMDGCEYGANPAEILIPRFLGQGGNFQSELIMIALSGGTAFDTTVDFLIFNDNEEIFSSEHTFNCWEQISLLDISGIFDNEFLAMWTNHDPLEMIGAPTMETGWIHIEGAQANSHNTTIVDPAVYAVLVERVSGNPSLGAADLPFEKGTRTNGEFLPRSNLGDIIDVNCGP